MRKFVILLGLVMLMVGVRLHYNWADGLGNEGRLIVYEEGREVSYEYIPTFINPYATVRVELCGDEESARSLIERLDGRVLFCEEVEKMRIIYAYSRRIPQFKRVHSKEVNIMIAVKQNNTILFGSPLLLGSY